MTLDPDNWVVSTFAGSGESGVSADGPALSAKFQSLRDIDFDAAGNIYVADYYVRQIDVEGNVTTISTFRHGTMPGSIASDASGNVFWTTRGQVWRKKVGEQPQLLAGAASDSTTGYADGQGTAARFNFVWSILAEGGITTDGAGNVFVADTGNGVIRKIDKDGVVSTYAGVIIPGLAGDRPKVAAFTKPRGICFDRDGNLYVADETAGRVRRVDPSGNITNTEADIPYVTDVACDRFGRIYAISDWVGSNGVYVMTESGAFARFVKWHYADGYVDGPISQARFNVGYPRFALDDSGNIFLADSYNKRIRKISRPE